MDLKPCVHDQRTWTKILIQEICNQLTCSFCRKPTILLAKYLDQDLGPSSLTLDIRLKDIWMGRKFEGGVQPER